MSDEGKLWEVTLTASVYPNRPSSVHKVKVRAWTGAEAELKAMEKNPKWKAVTRHTKIIEKVK
jgi:hypothetical protein